MKTVILIAFIGILAALAMAGVFMFKGRDKATEGEKSRAMMKALAMRVGISVGIFLLTLLAWTLGWIQPSGLRG
jgi:flagellar basal body-associated protein FliL